MLLLHHFNGLHSPIKKTTKRKKCVIIRVERERGTGGEEGGGLFRWFSIFCDGKKNTRRDGCSIWSDPFYKPNGDGSMANSSLNVGSGYTAHSICRVPILLRARIIFFYYLNFAGECVQFKCQQNEIKSVWFHVLVCVCARTVHMPLRCPLSRLPRTSCTTTHLGCRHFWCRRWWVNFALFICVDTLRPPIIIAVDITSNDDEDYTQRTYTKRSCHFWSRVSRIKILKRRRRRHHQFTIASARAHSHALT